MTDRAQQLASLDNATLVRMLVEAEQKYADMSDAALAVVDVFGAVVEGRKPLCFDGRLRSAEQDRDLSEKLRREALHQAELEARRANNEERLLAAALPIVRAARRATYTTPDGTRWYHGPDRAAYLLRALELAPPDLIALAEAGEGDSDADQG
jgi:hypothetical protein